MITTIPFEHYQAARDAVRARTHLVPRAGLVLGSGLGALADALETPITIPYHDIPHWPRSTVEGHVGRLVLGTLEGVVVIVQQGRAHYYEGYTPQQVSFPIRVMRLLGVEVVLLTNAAGGINPAYQVGDVMVLSDHINFVGLAGANPLVGPNNEDFGPRFVGMAQTYDHALRHAARTTATTLGFTLHEGVYAGVAGPMFETPAEIRMLRTVGADAVGMSTVNEVTVARHAGMRVFACSGITNIAIDEVDTPTDTNHQEVLEAGQVLVPRVEATLRGVLRSLRA